MKFDKGLYAALWSEEGKQVMSTVLQNKELIRPNFTFWATKFLVDPSITPTNEEGESIFTSKMRKLDTGEMMDMRAPLADTKPVDRLGASYYSDRIPDYSAKGYVEKAMERMYKEKLFAQFGDNELLANFASRELTRMINSANQTLSNQAAQVLSTGKIIYNYGEGIQGGVLKAAIPTENFHNAGEKVWADPSCKLLDQMRAIEEEYRDKWGVAMNMQWEIPAQMFRDVFMKNEQVIEWIRYVGVINNTPLPETFVATEDMTKRALAQYPDLSPIVIIEEKQKDGIRGIVNGWKEGVAVLRPTGYAGYIRRAAILDEEVFTKYGNSVNSYNFTPAINGLGVFMNSVVVNGNFKEWHTDLFMKAVPTLDEFLYHVIVDTKTAKA
jgi:hypothetical protein